MLKAVQDKVIVEPIEEDQVSSSGLVLTTLSKETPDQGTIVAVGPGILLGDGEMMVPEVEVGQKVIFSKYGGTDVEHEGKSYKILPYRDILAVIG
jgi:chaperonin GroES